MKQKKKPITETSPLQKYLALLPKGLVYTSGCVSAANSQKGDGKKRLLEMLYTKYAHCTRCPLGELGRTNVVFGEGDPLAQLMFVGEGPGRDEDLQARPFVGRAGHLLTSIINAMQLERGDVYITNTVKCRPPSNRTPLPQESLTCKNLLLLHEISIIQPRVICTLGAVATQALLGADIRLSAVRGRPQKINQYVVFPTYHPAYLLRNPSAKKIVWADMQEILQILAEKSF